MGTTKVPPNKIVFGVPSLCVSCHSCEIACQLAHSDAANIHAAAPADGLVSRVAIVRVAGGLNVPMHCRQCEDAPCARVCPTGAMHQNDNNGSVWVDEDVCIGCKMCTMVCPFGAVQVVTKPGAGPTHMGVAVKCDLCTDWREKNGKVVPACVSACPNKALRFMDIAAYRVAKLQSAAVDVASVNEKIDVRVAG